MNVFGTPDGRGPQTGGVRDDPVTEPNTTHRKKGSGVDPASRSDLSAPSQEIHSSGASGVYWFGLGGPMYRSEGVRPVGVRPRKEIDRVSFRGSVRLGFGAICTRNLGDLHKPIDPGRTGLF